MIQNMHGKKSTNSEMTQTELEESMLKQLVHIYNIYSRR